MCDMDGKPFYANNSVLQTIGLESLDEFNRVPIKDFFLPEDQHRVIEEFLPKARSEGFAETEIVFATSRQMKPFGCATRYLSFETRLGRH
jgi:PAS domain-containing protein